MRNDNALGWFYDIHTLSRSGTEFVTTANEAELQALAAQLDIPAVQSCEVRWIIKPWRKSGVRVIGELRAEVTQSCSVTLEPVAATVAEEIDVRLTSDASMVEGLSPGTGSFDFDPEDRDPPELFDGHRIELGDIAFEHLALGLDPYPRAPDAAFDGFEVAKTPGEAVPSGDGEDRSPFSALAHLASGSPERQKD